MLKETVDNFRSKKFFSLLLVEDELMVSKPMKKFLERLCDDVELASDGVEAWELYQKKSFSVVVTDLQMPNMNGAELIAKIKELNPQQAIVVVTAYREGKEYEKAQGLGVDYILKKPFSLQAFVDVLKELNI